MYLVACGLTGCSSILGIDDPTGAPGDAGPDDDAPPVSNRVAFTIGDFQIARQQSARVRTRLTLLDGTMQDATANATYSSDNPAIATVTTPGQIDAGSQAGVATISAAITGATPGTVKVTVADRACHPVINEFQTGGAAGPADEWVEILNPCTTPIDVTGWTLVQRGANTTGTQDNNLLIGLGGPLSPGEIRLFAGVDFPGPSAGTWNVATGIMGQTDGAIAIRNAGVSMGTVIDSVAYGVVNAANPFIEGAATPSMVNGRSAQRLPFDGHDDGNNGADFMLLTATTPGAPNAP